ncbi:MAG: hypothetical protein RL095_3763 [Verrucomicrobiota bacterium]|jgi:asparagine synthase (glutamine-hydrolysing)
MCGIAGQFALLSSSVLGLDKVDRSERILKSLASRGPDAQGLCQGESWVLGHVRLAILDPRGGEQPWVDFATSALLSYNGEIFNHLELRPELEARGHQFRTHCDTETLMAAWLEWGEACLPRLQGFFAFALWDRRRDQLFLVRDRLGEKPLHYCVEDGALSFASTAAACQLWRRGEALADPVGISHYLGTCRSSLGGRTLIAGLSQIEPGCLLRLDRGGGGVSLRRWWSLPRLSAADKPRVSWEAAGEQVLAHLDAAVGSRLLSDVPLGSFLSGGLDSSAVCLAAAAAAGHPFPAFCARATEGEDEEPWARQMAAAIGAPLESVTLGVEGFLSGWRHLIRDRGLPLSTPNEISIWRLAAAARKSCTVILSGEGSDEVYGGYAGPLASAWDFERAPHSPESEDAAGPLHWKLYSRHGRAHFWNDADHFFSTTSWISPGEKAALIRPELWQYLEGDDAVFSWYEDFFSSRSELSPFDRRLHLMAEVNLQGLLGRVDACTMAASVEARVPFTDHRLVEHAFTLPDEMKIFWPGGPLASPLLAEEAQARGLLETKAVLRRALSTRLPEAILKRPKASFPVPFESWLQGEAAAELRREVAESPFLKGWFQSSALTSQCRGRNLWLLANLAIWAKEFRIKS